MLSGLKAEQRALCGELRPSAIFSGPSPAPCVLAERIEMAQRLRGRISVLSVS